jgi:hypothetical protein
MTVNNAQSRTTYQISINIVSTVLSKSLARYVG